MKLPLQSPNLVSQNIERIAALFPNCITETANGKAIDFDLLKQELNSDIVDGLKERYRLEWAGKREAIVTANLPTTKTLRPIKADSVDFDTTQNLYIEGDNLEVLKLLQESYLGKVKMIYIDPPYNTGKDFVYSDKWLVDSDKFMLQNAEKDETGQRLFVNPETSGRYHSDWLTMIYPRLKLARNLLTDDGVIFISIDDNEVHNLRKVCDEVFGEGNFIGTIIWKNATDNNPTQIAVEHEYSIVYSKQKDNLESEWKSKISDVKDLLIKIGTELIEKYQNIEELQVRYNDWYRSNKNELWPLDRYKYIDLGGVYTGSQSVHNPGREGYRYDVIHPTTKLPCKQPLMGYRFPKERMTQLLADRKILFGEDHSKIIELKLYAYEFEAKLSSIIEFDGRIGSYDLKDLFEDSKRIFTNPKPVKYLNQFIPLVLKNNDIILDFFSGSATTAHAVMQLNAEDGGNRKFIMVQVPEATDVKSEAFKAGYKNICEIGKERIRRAGKQISDKLLVVSDKKEQLLDFEQKETTTNNSQLTTDIGFRVYRLDSSNMQDVYYKPQDYKQENLDLFASNIKPDRTPEDLLAQVMLSWGLPLHYKIETLSIQDKQVFKVEQDSLFACFANGIDEAFAKEIATHQPLRIVFKDDSFTNDTAKENVKQLLKQLSPNTEMKVI